jgi:aminoglycoside 3-N-acetyltransferase
MIIKKILKVKKRFAKKYYSKTYNKDQIVNDLNKFGIKPGMSVFIHSSLSKLGNIVGGPKTIVNSFERIIDKSKGTIMMPGFTIKGSMKGTLEYLEENKITYDYRTEVPLVGAIPKAFFMTEGVERSCHPTHSVLAMGKNAKYITNTHVSCNTTFGEGTPLYKLIETESYIMGLGSDIAHLTFYHVLEDINKNFPVEVYDKKEFIIKMAIEGGEKEFKIKAHKNQDVRIEKLNGTWVKAYFKKYFRSKGVLKEGKVGAANCWMIKAKDLYQCIEELMNIGITIYSPAPNSFLKNLYKAKGVVDQINR